MFRQIGLTDVDKMFYKQYTDLRQFGVRNEQNIEKKKIYIVIRCQRSYNFHLKPFFYIFYYYPPVELLFLNIMNQPNDERP